MRPISFREAGESDVAVLSRLLVSLYAREAPGMLAGPLDAQATLTRRLLTSAPLGWRIVAESGGNVVATGSLATTESP